eukprot:scaffold84093_cov45-Attheya_sp.AAC.4
MMYESPLVVELSESESEPLGTVFERIYERRRDEFEFESRGGREGQYIGMSASFRVGRQSVSMNTPVRCNVSLPHVMDAIVRRRIRKGDHENILRGLKKRCSGCVPRRRTPHVPPRKR